MKESYIRFIGPIIPEYSGQLFRTIDEKIKQKFNKIHLMISSPGGSVFHGLTIYNFLKGAPVEIDTYNFGSVDSIGIVVYCAGEKRYSVPHARFLIHGVQANFQGNSSFDEKMLEEQLKSLKIDQQNIAKVIADTCGKKIVEIEKDMNDRTTLNPDEAQEYGLVHDIKSTLFPLDADFSVVGETVKDREIPFMSPTPPGIAVAGENKHNNGLEEKLMKKGV